MKHSNFRISVLALAASSVLITGTTFARPPADCDLVHFAGATQQYAVNTPFIGSMSVTNLETGESHQADVATVLLGSVSEDGGRAVTSHEIDADGEPGYQLVTFDDAQLIPQGQGAFTLISHMKVKTGLGEYNCGELVIGADAANPENNSVVQFDLSGLGHASYSGLGRLCRCRPSDN